MFPSVWKINTWSRTRGTENCELARFCGLDTVGIMSATGPFQEFEMPPLHRHSEKCLVPEFWHIYAGIGGKLFNRAIKVVGRCLGCECEFVEEIKEFKRRAGFYHKLRSWIQPAAEELNVGRDCMGAVTVQDRDLVDAIRVEDKEG
jgi:hypothetical protein